jgi:hypothetical protein
MFPIRCPSADHLRGLPTQLELHLRNLVLLYRLALDEARGIKVATDWSALVQTVSQAVQFLLHPALALLLAAPGAPPRMFVPDN